MDNLDEARAMIEAENQQRQEACVRAVNEALSKIGQEFKCNIGAEPFIKDGIIVATLRVVAL